MSKIYVYPRLSSIDLSFIRIGGAGLANCMFVAARAFILAKRYNWNIIDPTWVKISLGPYIRGEKDKRHYNNFFNRFGVSWLKKAWLLVFEKRYQENKLLPQDHGVVEVAGLGNYFKDLIPFHDIVYEYFNEITKPNIIKEILPEKFSNVIGIHIRLGDYVNSLRTPIDWYLKSVSQINQIHPNLFSFYIFSDGQDEELKELLSIDNVSRVFFGNALSDIWALSKCRLIIGSDSTFSGWGAFLGQVPIIYPKCHYGNVLINAKDQLVTKDIDTISESFFKRLTIHVK